MMYYVRKKKLERYIEYANQREGRCYWYWGRVMRERPSLNLTKGHQHGGEKATNERRGPKQIDLTHLKQYGHGVSMMS